jgi:hypothetical protein
MKRASDLTREELETIVDTVQQHLHLDMSDSNSPVWTPDKEWDGSDVCEGMALVLDRFGLAPTQDEPFLPLSTEPVPRRFVLHDPQASELLGGRIYSNCESAAAHAGMLSGVEVLAVAIPGVSPLEESAAVPRQFPQPIKRFIRRGELPTESLPATTDDLLEAAGDLLDRASSHEILGEILFECQDGVIYVMTVEAVIGAANPECVKAIEAELADENRLFCRECGEPMIVDEHGVSYHVDSDGRIDYDTDASHTPCANEEPNP